MSSLTWIDRRVRRSVALATLSGLCAGGTAAADPPVGEIVDKVACRGSATQSYALYLPSGYSSDRSWPVLYAMDPAQRGRLPVELFREAAEEHGYILIGSLNAVGNRATAMRENMRALTVLWKDTHERFSIDDRRVYLTGMSGTARAACYRADLGPEPVAGVIACAAGFSYLRAPHAELGFGVFGAFGDRDYNFFELVEMGETLDALGVPNRMVSFDGAHGWPTADVAMEAIEWLEVRALQEGRRPHDAEHAAALLERAMSRIERRTSQGDVIGATSALADVLRDFEGLANLEQQRGEWQCLRDSKPLRKALETRAKLMERESRYRAQTERGPFSGIGEDNAAKSLDKLLDRLEVKKLKKQAASTKREERLSAKRLLATSFVQLAFYIPNEFEASKAYARAALSLRAADVIHPGQPRVLYRRSRMLALDGSADEAVLVLGKAIAAGYAQPVGSPEAVAQDPAFKGLVDRADFQALVSALRGPTEPSGL